MDYVMAVQAPARALPDGSFAVESAFAEHLLALRRALGASFGRIVLIAPELDGDAYEVSKAQFRPLHPQDGVIYVPACPDTVGANTFWRRHAKRIAARAKALMPNAGVVHVDLSTDIRKPLTAIVGEVARRAGKPTIFVVDIDFRQHASRFRALGHWGRGKYLFNRYVQDSFKRLQVRRAVSRSNLVLLKSQALVDDFGHGDPKVRNFYDTVHSDAQIIDATALDDRRARVADPSHMLRLCFFGRLVPYKGIDRVIEATRRLAERGQAIRVSIIGDGPSRASLKAQADAAGLGDVVSFEDPLPYGDALFARLMREDIVAATPLREDTPRAAFDAFARGIPIVAFDIAYFRDLAMASGAVELARWPDAAALADAIARLDGDRARLGRMMADGVTFAQDNTQDLWLERRVAWTRALALGQTA